MESSNFSVRSELKPTTIGRSWFFTIFWLVCVLGVCGLYVAQMYSEKGAGLFSQVFCGGLVLLFLSLAIFGSDTADCPDCGEGISISKDGDRSLCDGCQQLVISKQARAFVASEHVFEAEPAFHMPLKYDVVMPDCCAACGREATRTVPIHFNTSLGWKLLTGAAALASGQLSYANEKVTLQVPHCERHEDGAVLKDKDKPTLILFVKSYKFARDYKEKNDIELSYTKP